MTECRLLVASRNTGKLAELRDLLGDLNVSWLDLEQAGVTLEVAETGRTFKENAMLKAQAYASDSGLLTLADDSGLEVDCLDGRPGVLTARYGGEGLTSRQRIDLLLEEMREVPWVERRARFRAAVALADSRGVLGTATGVCEGFIAQAPSGRGGFGYDPIFLIPERGLTMAQLPAHDKHAISHRGRAIAAIKPLLSQVLRRCHDEDDQTR